MAAPSRARVALTVVALLVLMSITGSLVLFKLAPGILADQTEGAP
jgi:hypothetical protein